MAITIRERPAPARPLAQIFAVEPILLAEPAALEARQRGILLAKQQALQGAEALLRYGSALTWVIVFVSALHIWEIVAAIAPREITALRLPAPVYHGAALAFTLMIDACALFVSRANAVSAFVTGATPNRWGLYFYGVTALLNASFVASHAPAIAPHIQNQILPLLSASFVILLPLSVPVGIIAVEASMRTLEACRLALVIEVTTLRGITTSPREAARADSHSASGPIVEASPALPDGAEGRTPALPPIVGGKPHSFTVNDVVVRLEAAEGPLSPQELREQLRCGETTIHRLLQEGLATGRVAKEERGRYALPEGGAMA